MKLTCVFKQLTSVTVILTLQNCPSAAALYNVIYCVPRKMNSVLRHTAHFGFVGCFFDLCNDCVDIKFKL